MCVWDAPDWRSYKCVLPIPHAMSVRTCMLHSCERDRQLTGRDDQMTPPVQDVRLQRLLYPVLWSTRSNLHRCKLPSSLPVASLVPL